MRIDLGDRQLACRFGQGFRFPNAPVRVLPETTTIPRAILTLEIGPATLAVLDRIADAHERTAIAIERMVAGRHDGARSIGDVVPAFGSELTHIAGTLEEMRDEQRRIANHFDPPPPEIIGTEYIARKMGCSPTWVAELVRNREIPVSCIVRGTGNGKPWKFYRTKVERWLRER